MRFTRNALITLATFTATLGFAMPALALPSGPVVVAKASGKALLIWQATVYLDMLNARHETSKRALADVETGALQIVSSRHAQLPNAASISIRVLTTRTARNNDPHYAPTSFAGFQQVIVMTVTKAALAGASKWPNQVDPSHLPAGVTVEGAEKFKL